MKAAEICDAKNQIFSINKVPNIEIIEKERSFDDETDVRAFLSQVGEEMPRYPCKMEEYVRILEEEFIFTVG